MEVNKNYPIFGYYRNKERWFPFCSVYKCVQNCKIIEAILNSSLIDNIVENDGNKAVNDIKILKENYGNHLDNPNSFAVLIYLFTKEEFIRNIDKFITKFPESLKKQIQNLSFYKNLKNSKVKINDKSTAIISLNFISWVDKIFYRKFSEIKETTGQNDDT